MWLSFTCGEHTSPSCHDNKKPSAVKKDGLAGSSFTRIRQPSETVQKKCSPYHLCIPNCIRIISALKYLQRCSAKTISLTTSNTSFSLYTVYIHAIIAVMITLRSSTNQSHLLSPLWWSHRSPLPPQWWSHTDQLVTNTNHLRSDDHTQIQLRCSHDHLPLWS